jgi:hypothetical protein
MPTMTTDDTLTIEAGDVFDLDLDLIVGQAASSLDDVTRSSPAVSYLISSCYWTCGGLTGHPCAC